jgi:hypothetical protein
MAPSNSYLKKKDLDKKNSEYPLKIFFCEKCYLVQTKDFAKKEEFFSENYPYFSSASKTWLNHAKLYVRKIINFKKLKKDSFVIEVASNDGYLLKNFKKRNIPCLGIEPTLSTANKARRIGINTETIFLDKSNAKKIIKKYRKADLVIGNNVYAHVPDINNFTSSLELLLKDDGIVTLEFPHLLNLIKLTQFDTIYHEHFSYLSLHTVKKIFNKHKLKIFKVEEINTHGGSLRVYGCKNNLLKKIDSKINDILKKEKYLGLQNINTYHKFKNRVQKINNKLTKLLKDIKKSGKKTIAYGAAAKGNTLLNYCGIKKELIEAVIDISPSKQNKFMPTSHIPIYDVNFLKKNKLDYLLILPWNLKKEILNQNKFLKLRGVKFIIPIPDVKII